MDDQTVGARVSARREQLRLNQRSLADQANEIYPMSQSTLSRIESGERELRLAEAMAISAILGCPVDDLLAPNPLSQRALVALRTSGSEVPHTSAAVDEVLMLLRMTNDFCVRENLNYSNA